MAKKMQCLMIGIAGLMLLGGFSTYAENTVSADGTKTVRIASCDDYKAELTSKYIYNSLVKQNNSTVLQKYKIVMARWNTDCKKTKNIFTGTVNPLNTGYFQLANTNLLKNLSTEQRKTITSQTNLYGAIVMRQMNSLIASGFLSLDDKRALEKKITFTYVRSCNDPQRGLTTFKERRRDGAFLKNEIVGVNLKIFLCFEKQYVDEVTDDFIHVATHELAHYYNFIRDPDPFYFSTICWEQGNKKSSCPDSTFVTSYAASDDKEDYAETFAYWYLNKFPTAKKYSILRQKKKYFDTRYALIRQ